jgi:hypothetical protein
MTPEYIKARQKEIGNEQSTDIILEDFSGREVARLVRLSKGGRLGYQIEFKFGKKTAKKFVGTYQEAWYIVNDEWIRFSKL